MTHYKFIDIIIILMIFYEINNFRLEHIKKSDMNVKDFQLNVYYILNIICMCYNIRSNSEYKCRNREFLYYNIIIN